MSERVLHDPGNEAPADEMFGWFSFDEQGREGLVAHVVPGIGAMVLCSQKRKNAETLRQFAEEVSRMSGKPVRLIRFTRAEVLSEIQPGRKQ